MVKNVQGVWNLGGIDIELHEDEDFGLRDGVGADGSGGNGVFRSVSCLWQNWTVQEWFLLGGRCHP